MKRLLASALALSLLAGSAATAQAGEYSRRAPSHGHFVKKKVVTKQHRWRTGGHVPSAYRRHFVNDYHRHHLRAPRHGERWIRVGNDYLLVSIVSGFIAGVVAAH
jgi:Ni/Co efflux regulator RcnB